MADPISFSTALGILERVVQSAGILTRLFKQQMLADEALRYLSEKYKLQARYWSGPPGRYGTSGHYHSYDAALHVLFDQLANSLSRASYVNTRIREQCADLALVIFVANTKHSFLASFEVHYYGRELYGTKTWTSLEQIGRGFGDMYALKIVNQEIKEFKN